MYGEDEVTVSEVNAKVEPAGEGSATVGGF